MDLSIITVFEGKEGFDTYAVHPEYRRELENIDIMSLSRALEARVKI